MPFTQMPIPVPTSPSSGARSKAVAGTPARVNASAALSPPMPPPMIRTLFVRSVIGHLQRPAAVDSCHTDSGVCEATT